MYAIDATIPTTTECPDVGRFQRELANGFIQKGDYSRDLERAVKQIRTVETSLMFRRRSQWVKGGWNTSCIGDSK